MKDVIKPKVLTEHAGIGVFTPSEPITKQREPRVAAGIAYLKSKGYRVVTGDNYLKNRYYMGGTVAERVDDIHSLLDRDDVDALFASWGGKSCNQILPSLDYERFRISRKALLGFSDSTCLANAVYAKTGLINFLGPNIVGKLDESDHSDLCFLRSPSRNAVLIGRDDSVENLRSGKCTGRLIGGTIGSLVHGVIHTEFEPELEGCILFLEAGSKSPQILDQLLTYMSNAHRFDGVAGLVICNLDHSKDDRDWGGRSSLEIFLEKFAHLEIPIIHTPVIGHGKQKNPIMPVGALCTLDADEGVLRLLEAVVE